MRKGFIWLVVILVVAMLVMLLAPVLIGLFGGAGFDPS